MQLVPDKLYFMLIGAIRSRLQVLSPCRGSLVVVRAVSGAIGTGWKAELKRSALAAWLFSNPWIRAYGSLVNGVAYRSTSYGHPVHDWQDWKESKILWCGLQGKEDQFSLPMGGIGGKVESVPGFRISRLIIPAAGGKSLEYRRVCVFVNDVSTTLDSGETVILDGILGTSLWFPTVAGIDSGFPTDAAPSAFETVWIDGPGKRLMFKFQLVK